MNIVPYNEIERMGTAIAQSKLFGAKTPQEAIALMLVAQSEGLHPARAAIEYHIIQGKPALKADAMLARFQAQGGSVKWTSYTDEKVAGVFSHPQGGSVEIDWTIDRAKQAGVYGKNPTWRTYQRAMLRSRCISEGIRTVFPGVSIGVCTPEEVQDFEPVEKDITPPREGAPVPMPEKVKQMAAKLQGREDQKPTKPEAPKVIEQAPQETILASAKADDEVVRNMVKIYHDKLDMTVDDLEFRHNKSIDEFTNADVDKAREMFKKLLAEKTAAAQQDGGEEI